MPVLPLMVAWAILWLNMDNDVGRDIERFFFIKFFNQYLGSMKLLISSSHSVSDLVWRHTGWNVAIGTIALNYSGGE